MLWHTKQVLGHNAEWNQCSRNIRRSVQNMPKGQQTFLHIKHTTSTTCQTTNLCINSLCQGQGWNPEKMFPTDQEGCSLSIPTSIAPNVWMITSPTTAIPSGITLICPEEAPRSVTPETPIHVLQLQPACSATSQQFYLPPCYESHEITINISLNTADLNIVNISAPEFRIWQHLEDHGIRTLLHHLVNIPSVPIEKLYK